MSSPAKFLFDECLGKPSMEKLLGLLIDNPHFAHITDFYGQGTPDTKWIPEIAAQGGWVVISSDLARKSKVGEKLPELCKEHKVTHVLLSAAIHRKKAQEKVAAILLMWDKIKAIHAAPPGTRFKLKLQVRKGDDSPRLVFVKEDD